MQSEWGQLLFLRVSCRRELNLGGFGTPKSIKNRFVPLCSRHVFRTRFGEAKNAKINVRKMSRDNFFGHFERLAGTATAPRGRGGFAAAPSGRV